MFCNGEMSVGTISSGISEARKPGQWRSVLTHFGTNRGVVVEGARLWAELRQAQAEGFTRDEIGQAFNADPEALDAIRAAAVEVVTAHAASLGGRTASAHYRQVAESGRLPGFTTDDLGGMVDEVYAEEVERTVEATDLPELLALVDELTGGGVE